MSPPDPIRPDPPPPMDVQGLSKLGAILTVAVGVPAVIYMFAKAGFLAGIFIAVGLAAFWIKFNQALNVTEEERQSGRKRSLPETIFMVAVVLALLWINVGMMISR